MTIPFAAGTPKKVTTGAIQGSRKAHSLAHAREDIRVPFREIPLSDAALEPVRVYDTSGPYTDPETRIDLEAGLPPLRENWIASRNFETIRGRDVKPEDNGNVPDDRLVVACPAEAGRPGQPVRQYEFAKAGLR